MSEIKSFAKTLIIWQGQSGRSGLPWQGQTDPYRVWLSEIMLQQTQVQTVCERYRIFLDRYPHLASLAQASEEDVMALWAGLGYYTRARNLLRCAQQIQQQYGGEFPKDAKTLATLPGIGKSTAAAIAAFCFLERTSILDANVKRLFARLYGISEPLNLTKTNQQLWGLAQRAVPASKADMPQYTQGLMDFGAIVCKPSKPRCLEPSPISHCVFQTHCQAYNQGQVDVIPYKVKKSQSPIVLSEMLLCIAQGKVLLEKRPSSGIWGGLWSLPETSWQRVDQFKEGQRAKCSFEDFQHILPNQLETVFNQGQLFAPRKHLFTHRTLYFGVRVLQLKKLLPKLPIQYIWQPISGVDQLGLPTPVKQLLIDLVI